MFDRRTNLSGKTQWVSRVFFGALLLSAMLAMQAHLVGCETTKGAGKDIEKAGEGIQDAAD